MKMKQQIHQHRNTNEHNSCPKHHFQCFRFHIFRYSFYYDRTNKQKCQINVWIMRDTYRDNHEQRKNQAMDKTKKGCPKANNVQIFCFHSFRFKMQQCCKYIKLSLKQQCCDYLFFNSSVSLNR
jgi:hypothetical protein